MTRVTPPTQENLRKECGLPVEDSIPVPLRVEIEALLGLVLKPNGKTEKAKTKASRNRSRTNLVDDYLKANYSGDNRLKTTVLEDLSSYGGWEREIDDEVEGA